MNNDKLYGWVFTKKGDIWYATKNDNYFALFNGENDRVIKSRSIETLQELIIKTNGDSDKLKTLVWRIK